MFSLSDILLSFPTMFFSYKFQQVHAMLKIEAHHVLLLSLIALAYTPIVILYKVFLIMSWM